MKAFYQQHIENIRSNDKHLQNQSYETLLQETNEVVDWAYDVWDELLDLLQNGDNHQRSIAAQVLSNLTKSDPQNKMLNDLDQLIQGTKDEKFVTARHTLQCLWKVGVEGEALRQKLINKLTQRYTECEAEKNTTLIRYDITEVLRKIYDQVADPSIVEKSLELISHEKDEKYRKKYTTVWKGVLKKDQKMNR